MDIYFWIFAVIGVAAGIFTISYKDALPCALGLLTVFMSLAALYVHLHAPLVAIFQVAIYAGAILILVVFVIMLLMTPDEDQMGRQKNIGFRIMGFLLGLLMMCYLAIGAKGIDQLVNPEKLPKGFGDPHVFGDLLFKQYLLHFEVASVLLLVALIGGVYLAKKRL